MTILQSSIAPPTGGYQISRSLRFNSADSAYLNRTPASNGNRQTWTLSFWLKLGTLSTNRSFFGAGTNGSNYFLFYLTNGDVIRCEEAVSGVNTWNVVTTPVYRDPSAWYHIVMAFDSPQATSSNRIKLYVNGVQVTAFSTATYPTQNLNSSYWNATSSHNIGAAIAAGVAYGNGYMTEVNFIDGQALTPSSFGQTNASTGVWEPVKYTGTYGTNGFYLNFSDNSNTTSTTLGKDSSGNGNNWTPNGFSVTAGAGDDSVVDTPTSYGTNTGAGGEIRGNYVTRNPLAASTSATGSITNGNLDAVWSSGGSFDSATTMGFDATDATGYYWEYLVNGTALSIYPFVGIANSDAVIAFTGKSGGSNQPGTTSGGWMFRNASGNKFNSNSATSYGTATTSGWGCVAVKNGKIFIGSISGGTITWKNSGNPITEANPMFSGITGTVFPVTSEYSSGTVSYNFGQKPFQATAPSGFKALCTQNLPTPTIGATSTTQANRYFDATIYAGTATAGGAQTQNISVNFQPDFLWIKNRTSASSYHLLVDAVRGANSLSSNVIDAEIVNGNQSLTSTGYTVAGNAGTVQYNPNLTGNNYVGWVWNAGGSNATNTSGSITSTVRANTTAGFSIVTYTGTGVNATVGHGLGVVPSMIIAKRRSATQNWGVWHTSLTGTQTLYLDLTQAVATGVWNGTPTSTIFNITTDGVVNASTSTYVAYCFAAVAGYSAFGSYTGNGSTDGPFVYTGFRPRFIMIKNATTGGAGYNWFMYDTTRDTYNVAVKDLCANLADSEDVSSQDFDILSNGFKFRGIVGAGATNGSGQTYIYAAFAESPFKYALAR